MKQYNKRTTGANFDTTTIERVWLKGRTLAGHDPATIRLDACGAVMVRSQYGKTDSVYGWEIDHIRPASKGGSDHIDNLQPLQWENNRHKADAYPHWSCARK